MSYKIGILTPHPVQYKVPWYRALAAREDTDLTVYYCMLPDAKQQGDGFGVEFEWDVPLLEGYRYEVLENVSPDSTFARFGGCDTPGIYERVRVGGFDAFIVNGWVVKSCMQALLACRRYHVPCIVRGESNAIRPRVWWKRLIHRCLLSRYSAFLNIGQSNKDFYMGNGVPEKRIFFAPYSVDNELFGSAASVLRPTRDTIRSGWGIQPRALVALFCAKFIHKKRPLDLLRAASLANDRLKGDGGSIHVLMVGDGELKAECERVVRESGLPTTFAGFLNQSELPRGYVAADCLVLPSDDGETWGLVVNEAMACGLPAIVSDHVGCHPDLVLSGETGDVFPLGDCRALADVLVSFASDPERVKAMGGRAKERVADYCIENVVKGTMEAVQFVCERKQKKE